MDITVHDATYLELAQDLDCQVVTSDKPFRDKVLAGVFDESSRIVLLRDYPANRKGSKNKAARILKQPLRIDPSPVFGP